MVACSDPQRLCIAERDRKAVRGHAPLGAKREGSTPRHQAFCSLYRRLPGIHLAGVGSPTTEPRQGGWEAPRTQKSTSGSRKCLPHLTPLDVRQAEELLPAAFVSSVLSAQWLRSRCSLARRLWGAPPRFLAAPQEPQLDIRRRRSYLGDCRQAPQIPGDSDVLRITRRAVWQSDTG